MTAPRRIQLRRTKGWRKPEGAVSVARPTKWGNPFKLAERTALARVPAIDFPDQPWEYEGRISADGMRHDFHHPGGAVTEVHVRYMTRAEIVDAFRALVNGGGWPLGREHHWDCMYPSVQEIRAELAGKDLACWCPTYEPCHADVLLEIANGGGRS